ncbi:MAG: hypothetical protein A2Z96_01335 [Spirochaetes bacterium GWB1_48_6]|nr:MAG: hypothetical protein A2Z96_01335 [Spirochaetes bacterium GWB1_48_6]
MVSEGAEKGDSGKKVSFFEKNDTICPICAHTFKKEVLLSGGGRMIAGNLQQDLRRKYEPSKKFGEVFPYIYYVTTCPGCWYSALSTDFTALDPKVVVKIEADTENRKKDMGLIFDSLDFTGTRSMKEGTASYYLALNCYQYWPSAQSPTFKMAVCALRSAWGFSELHRKFPGENYDYLEKILYHKARFLYQLVMEKEQSGQESVGSIAHFGPDVDNNFGFDGVMYLAGFLEYKYGDHSNEQKRLSSLSAARRAIAKLVGMGKSSKNKPSVLVEMARDLHHEMGEEFE